MMKWLNCKCFDKASDWAPLVLRLSAGLVFVAHGWQKYGAMVAFGDFLDSLGVPLPGLFAGVVVAVEIIGGAALILVLFTHWAAKLLALDMLAAFFLFHWSNGVFVQNNGYELVLLLFTASFAVTVLGAGKWSLDKMFWK